MASPWLGEGRLALGIGLRWYMSRKAINQLHRAIHGNTAPVQQECWPLLASRITGDDKLSPPCVDLTSGLCTQTAPSADCLAPDDSDGDALGSPVTLTPRSGSSVGESDQASDLEACQDSSRYSNEEDDTPVQRWLTRRYHDLQAVIR